MPLRNSRKSRKSIYKPKGARRISRRRVYKYYPRMWGGAGEEETENPNPETLDGEGNGNVSEEIKTEPMDDHVEEPVQENENPEKKTRARK